MRNWIANQFRTFRKVSAWWRNQLTVVGKVVFLIMLGSLPSLADSGAVWAIVFMASSMLLLVASAFSFAYRPRLDVKATCPHKWMRSECRTLRLEVTNRSRRTLYDLELRLLPVPGVWQITEAVLKSKCVAPGETVIMTGTARALRRGPCELPKLEASTQFPLHLVRQSEIFSLARTPLILPFFHPLQSFALAQQAPNVARGDNLALQAIGVTGEYIGSREYQPGIRVRKWDYPSWARLGQPVVREFSEPRHPSAAIFVDTFFPGTDYDSGSSIPELEAILSLAAAISHQLLARGNRVDMLSVGDQLWTPQDRSSGDDHLAILECLALAQPCSTSDLSQLSERIDTMAVKWDLAVVVSHDWEAGQERLFQLVTPGRTLGQRIHVHPHAVGRRPHSRRPGLPGAPCEVTHSQIDAGVVNL